MKILLCPDSFKGTLSSPEVAAAMLKGIAEIVPDANTVSMPLGDGGEGTLSVIAERESGMKVVSCDTLDALHRPIKSRYYISDTGVAYIESAAASGLTLIKPEERDILRADTYGTGLMVADALRKGVRRFVMGMGGTATCDGGSGAYEALSEDKKILEAALESEFTLLCDVENPLCGPLGAAPIFGPQKGATPEIISVLEQRLKKLAETYCSQEHPELSSEKYGGAAGGLAAMFISRFKATPVSGIEYVIKRIDLEKHIKDADLVLTGEGKADATTLSGKAPRGVLDIAKKHGVRVAIVGGRVEDTALLQDAGFDFVVQATPRGEEPGGNAQYYVSEAVKEVIKKAFPSICVSERSCRGSV